MLIKEVTQEDITVWLSIAHEADDIIARMVPDIAVYYMGFSEFMRQKIARREAFKAWDTIAGKCMGVVAFNRDKNLINFLGIPKSGNYQTIGKRLMDFVFTQLDPAGEITAIVPDSNAGVFQKEKTFYRSFSFIETNDKIMENGIQAVRMKRAGNSPS